MKKSNLKRVILSGCSFLIIMAISCSKQTKTPDKKYLDKVQTIDSTIETLYDVISGEKGEPRDWELFKFLFHPEGKMIHFAPNKEGNWGINFRTPEDYIKSSGAWLQKTGFYETEIYKRVDSHGNIATVISTYESYYSKYDEKPFMRGFNNFQLLNDGQRWWIINIFWQRETPNNPISKEYLPTK
jgi:hypothetical protein